MGRIKLMHGAIEQLHGLGQVQDAGIDPRQLREEGVHLRREDLEAGITHASLLGTPRGVRRDARTRRPGAMPDNDPDRLQDARATCTPQGQGWIIALRVDTGAGGYRVSLSPHW